MGWNLLRRKILRIFLPALLILAGLVSSGGLFTDSNLLYAAESSEVPPEAPFFSRPLRTKHSSENFPYASAYTRERKKYSKNTLLTPASLKNPVTQQYIRQYSTPNGLSWLTAVMERGGPYLAFIRKEIAERNMPEELVYLPVIESGFLSTALSKSGASGLWQFMKNSMGPFDMQVTDWMDERRDFWKSTQGALRKLEENYKHFGDWPLALVAYNAGLGEISRTIQRNGLKDYWALSEKKLLKAETAHYVPKLLAVAYILSNQRQFNLTPKWPENPEWTRIAAKRPTDLRLLAKEAEISAEELIWANRELLYDVTPPGQNYYLKIRGNLADKAAAVLNNMNIPLVNHYFHTVRSGDTLFAIALHSGVSVDQILTSNPDVEARYLKIGSRLLIPTLKETVPYEKQRAPKENIKFDGTHLVKKGETLWSIALVHEVDPEILAEANDMGLNDILREGKVLKTPIK